MFWRIEPKYYKIYEVVVRFNFTSFKQVHKTPQVLLLNSGTMVQYVNIVHSWSVEFWYTEAIFPREFLHPQLHAL